jgi:hypothetical protein
VDAGPQTDVDRSKRVSKKEYVLFVIVVLMFALVAVAAGQKASTPKAQDKKEYMNFMEAEFNRLDKDKSGELDPKELTRSQFRASHPFGSGK